MSRIDGMGVGRADIILATPGHYLSWVRTDCVVSCVGPEWPEAARHPSGREILLQRNLVWAEWMLRRAAACGFGNPQS